MPRSQGTSPGLVPFFAINECAAHCSLDARTPTRALAPLHAWGLCRVVFLHHLHSAKPRLGNALRLTRLGAVYLRNPAPKEQTPRAELDSHVTSQEKVHAVRR